MTNWNEIVEGARKGLESQAQPIQTPQATAPSPNFLSKLKDRELMESKFNNRIEWCKFVDAAMEVKQKGANNGWANWKYGIVVNIMSEVLDLMQENKTMRVHSDLLDEDDKVVNVTDEMSQKRMFEITWENKPKRNVPTPSYKLHFSSDSDPRILYGGIFMRLYERTGDNEEQKLEKHITGGITHTRDVSGALEKMLYKYYKPYPHTSREYVRQLAQFRTYLHSKR